MNWTRVCDALPDVDCTCVVYNESRPYSFYVCNYCAHFKEFEAWMIGMSRMRDPICVNATHWMKLETEKDKEQSKDEYNFYEDHDVL